MDNSDSQICSFAVIRPPHVSQLILPRRLFQAAYFSLWLVPLLTASVDCLIPVDWLPINSRTHRQTTQSARRGHDLVYFLFMARAGLTGESRPRNDDVVPMRLARTMVIGRIQLAVYCLSNCFAGKSLTCFAPRSYRYKHPQ